ncbi:MAG: (2Fe-2S)-binding protein [Chloroflexota bacterium]|nr:(2Fe-2S)-binding protein [Chloroflexota bacterium]
MRADLARAISLVLHINGEQFEREIQPRMTLADALRDICGLTGTHLGCEHGVCGACTVLLDGEPVRSCLMFAVQAEGHHVRTIEDLSSNGDLHPLQLAFLDRGAFQCGFCTPGFVMLSLGVLEEDPAIEPQQLREVLSSNLCRCTGYQAIVDAVTDYQRGRQ